MVANIFILELHILNHLTLKRFAKLVHFVTYSICIFFASLQTQTYFRKYKLRKSHKKSWKVLQPQHAYFLLLNSILSDIGWWNPSLFLCFVCLVLMSLVKKYLTTTQRKTAWINSAMLRVSDQTFNQSEQMLKVSFQWV
jgi:hypothetical protein